MLLRTAVQAAMVCPVLAQAHIAIYHITNDVYAWSQADQAGDPYRGDSAATLWSGGLLIVNSTMLLMAQVPFTAWPLAITCCDPDSSHPDGASLATSSARGGSCQDTAQQVLRKFDQLSKKLLTGGGGDTGWLYRDPALDTVIT